MNQKSKSPCSGAARLGTLGALFSLAGLLIALPSAPAQFITQSITLQPGWNAIWLEVQPENRATSAVFSNLPVASVWTRAERLSAVDFIQDPSEQAFNEAGWLGWFHPSRPEAFLGSLFVVQANRAYLVKVTNATPISLTLSGRPSLRRADWVPDAYNLRGLPVDPASPPTFLSFFRPSAAHYDPTTGQLQRIYRLNAAGQWTQIAPMDGIKSGEAYWVYSKGASDYAGPLKVSVELGDSLDYGLQLTELNLRLANLTGGSMNVLVQDLGLAGSTALSYYRFDPSLGGQWPNLPAPLAVSPAAGSEERLRLAVRRQDIIGASYNSILQVRDGAGTRFLVPVTAETVIAPASPLARQAGPTPHASIDEAKVRAGLWVGTATINAVAEAHSAQPATPTPTKSEFNLRLLVHVDSNGQARLLKDVLQMWRDGTYTNDSSGNLLVDKAGRYVLLTDDTLIPLFQGAAVRDGESVGRRLSSIGYDFPSGPTNNFLNLAGFFTFEQKLNGTLTMPFDHPTNPYQHKFHPDHDNLNVRFDGPAIEAYSTTRQIELEFSTVPPGGPASPDYGYNVMGGNYRETISGLHKTNLYVSGAFRLTRVSLITDLNPNPSP